MAKKIEQEKVVVPDGYIRVHGINYKIEVALAIARQLKEQLIHMHQDPRYQTGKGRDYARTLEDKVEVIFKEVNKIKK